MIYVYFQFYNPKVSYKRCFILCLHYKQSALRKKELIAFLGEHFNENTICIDFQFHNSKSQESCFYVLDRVVLNGVLRKKQS